MSQNYTTLWKEKRNKIRNKYQFNAEWEDIIDYIFKERIYNYFLNPIKTIINKKEWKWEWFSVLALECLLIETLAAFRDWKCYNYQNNSWYYYKDSRKLFIKFLKNKKIWIFEGNFWTKDWTNPIWIAEKFYSEVRCWILHEAQTKWNWTINTSKWAKRKGYFLEKKNGKIQIYRTTLYCKLESYIGDYCKELKEVSKTWEELRKKLWRKLDHMFEINEKAWFDWWV